MKVLQMMRKEEVSIMRKSLLLAVAVLTLCGQVFAGGVMEMSTKKQGGPATLSERIYAQGGKLRFDQLDAKGALQTTMLFQNNEVLMVSHPDTKFHRINEATMEELSAQMQKASAAMKQMEQQMANMPPEQRAMMEKMMKGRMPGMAGMGAKPLAIRVEATGPGSWESYSCKNYSVYVGDEKTQELCAVPPGEIKGADEFIEAARNMAKFFEKFRESMQMPAFANLAKGPVEVIGQVDGFPVHTKEFQNGVLQGERFLSSAKEESLSDDTFSPPAGYKEEKIAMGRGGSR
jgi:hypothetical protein